MLTTKKHNSSSIKFYLFLILTFTQLITNVYPRCYDYPSPLSRKKVWSNCSMVEELDGENLTGGPTTGNSTNMFQVSFNCGITDATLCNKVKNAFDTAGQIISSIVTFNTPVMVNVSFFDFCLKLNSCPSGGLVILGGAAPARTILLQDDDGMARLYPQALVKQYQFPKHPQFGPFDILAQFNSNGASYWFQGDPPITPNQQDFLYVILHEMIHGLGFTSNWLDYINDDIEALTPEVGINGATGVNGPVSFSGFFESAFDRYMINIPQAKRTSLTTDQLNKFAGTIPVNTGLKFTSANDFVSKFRSSSQYKLAQNMLTLSITKNSLGFIPHDTNKTSDAVVLETSLSPFRQGSSVSHVDYNTYNNTNDFLMKFLADKGVDLNTLITMRSPDKQNRNDLTLAIGPKLKTVLETLGYTTTNYKSTYKPNTAIVSNTLTSSGNSLQPNDGSNSTNTNTNTNTNVPNQKTSVGPVTNKPNIIFALIFMVISISMKSIYV